jgi:hypothetical protein
MSKKAALTLSAQNANKPPLSPKRTFVTFFQRWPDEDPFQEGQRAQNLTEKRLLSFFLLEAMSHKI